MISAETVCPPADDDDFGKPRVEGLKQFGEAIEFRIVNFVAYSALIIVRSFGHSLLQQGTENPLTDSVRLFFPTRGMVRYIEPHL
jgi:hypothetical protein